MTSQSALMLAQLIRKRDVSPVDVVQAHLDRIEETNRQLNAIVTVASDVMERARDAEAAVMRGESLGQLHGVPITIKDTIETEGLRTTSGSATRAQFVPDSDAVAVARLKAAGAIILGKTNTAEMAMDYTADNPVFGRTNNPHDFSRSPGGSSGGEAAAIAVSMSPAGIGSDLAGSIRIPAHFCGVTGFKPASKAVPSSGQFPASVGPYSLGSVIGPLARFVEDLRLLYGVLVGSEICTPVGSSLSDQVSTEARSVSWYTNDEVSPVNEETAAAVKSAAAVLGQAGFVTTERRPPGIERGHDLWLKLFSRASVVLLRETYRGREEEAGGFVRWRLATADELPTATLDDYIRAWIERDRLRTQLIQWMNQSRLLIAPVGATEAFPHDAHKLAVADRTVSVFRAFSYSQTFNVFDLPALAIPVGRSRGGLPIAVQLVCRPDDEELLFSAATILEKALGGWQPPPGMSDEF